jgi:hypothetical protein
VSGWRFSISPDIEDFMAHSLDQYPQRDGLYRILPQGVAVHNRYADRVIILDSFGSELWLRADGKTTLREIAYDIAAMNGQPVEALARAAATMLVVLSSEGLMFQRSEPTMLPYHLSLPQEEQDTALMRASLTAAGWIDE